MIEIEYKGKKASLKSEPKDFTLRDLVEITKFLDSDKVILDRYLDVVDYLGGKELADSITGEDLAFFMQNLNINSTENKVVPYFELDGKKYVINIVDDNIVISGKELAFMERLITKEKEWAHMIFALLYKQEGMNSTDNLNYGHIKKKANLFLDYITCDVATPVIIRASKKVVENVEKMREAIAKT